MVPSTRTPPMVRPCSALVVVEEAHGAQTELWAALDLAQQQRSRAASAHDEDAVAFARLGAAQVDEHAGARTDAGDPEQDQHRLHEQHADGYQTHALGGLEEVVDDGEQGEADEHRAAHPQHRVDAHVAQHQAVEAEQREERQVHDGRSDDRDGQAAREVGGDGALEAGVVRDQRRDGDDGGVEHVEQRAGRGVRPAGPRRACGSRASSGRHIHDLADRGDGVVDVGVGECGVDEEGE